jgi:hypothetical protein
MATKLRELDVDLIIRGHLEKGLEHLGDEFAGTFSNEMIERYMAESMEALAGARLTDYVPLFVHRFARERLRALGQIEGTIAKTVPEVLFVSASRSACSASSPAHLRRSTSCAAKWASSSCTVVRRSARTTAASPPFAVWATIMMLGI